MDHPLPREARQVLARLELVSNGCIYSYAPVASKGGFTGSAPATGDPMPPHLFFRAEFEHVTDSDFPDVLERAQDELASLTRRSAPVRLETVQQRDRRMIVEGAGFTVLEVATRFRCGPRDVRRVRRAAGRDVESGKPIAVPTVAGDGSSAALALRKAGYSTREIAKRLGTNQTQVMRWVRSAA